MKKIITILLVTGYNLGRAYAQAPDPDTTARHFIIMASIGNLQEVNCGKLAEKKATRADVKSFGNMMVTDHSQAEQKLMQLARERSYQIPAAVTEIPPYDLNLSKASGDDFDRMYIHAMASSHGSTVKMFQNYAIAGKDPEVKAFARDMLPTLKEHLEAIKALDKKYKDLSAK
jgi:putative membrane protein